MKYLDEQIKVTVNGFSVPSTGVYIYNVLDPSNTVLFQGNVFLTQNTTTKEFDITDILRNLKPSAYILNLPLSTRQSTTPLINKYRVQLTIGVTNYTSTAETVALIYRYPNRKQSLDIDTFDYDTYIKKVSVLMQGGDTLLPRYPFTLTDNYPFAFTVEAGSEYAPDDVNLVISGGLEGTNTISITSPTTQTLLPLSTFFASTNPYHSYPQTVTSLSGFTEVSAGVFEDNQMFNQHDIEIYIYDSTDNQYVLQYSVTQSEAVQMVSYDLAVTENNINDLISHPIAIVVNDGVEEGVINIQLDFTGWENKQVGKNLNISFKATEELSTVRIDSVVFGLQLEEEGGFVTLKGEKIADIDSCPSRYYLLWQDRGGSYQSQPFNDRVTYSESFDREETRNYYNNRQLSNVIVNPKWKINSTWIPQDLYPYYESIFVSSHLLLYDTREDQSYNVIVTESEYTEKTFKNQKSLFNIQLELEAVKSQNIIY